jgi:hypothetical protein
MHGQTSYGQMSLGKCLWANVVWANVMEPCAIGSAVKRVPMTDRETHIENAQNEGRRAGRAFSRTPMSQASATNGLSHMKDAI